MKRLCFLIVIGLFGCDDSVVNRNSIEYFQKHLREEMEYSDLRLRFGEPDADIGSGIHIYVYNLDDGTQVTIGFTDKILYARHINETQILSELI
jgi:hypothetical protein